MIIYFIFLVIHGVNEMIARLLLSCVDAFTFENFHFYNFCRKFRKLLTVDRRSRHENLGIFIYIIYLIQKSAIEWKSAIGM